MTSDIYPNSDDADNETETKPTPKAPVRVRVTDPMPKELQ